MIHWLVSRKFEIIASLEQEIVPESVTLYSNFVQFPTSCEERPISSSDPALRMERTNSPKSRVIRQRFPCARHKSKKEVFFREATLRSGDARPAFHRKRKEDGEVAARTAEIRMANCRQSGWLGSRIVILEIPMPGILPAYTVLSGCRVSSGERKKTEERNGDDCRAGKRRPLHPRRAGRLGFFGKTPAELRKGDFFSCARLTICVLSPYVRYSHRIFSPLSFPSSSFRLAPVQTRYSILQSFHIPCFVDELFALAKACREVTKSRQNPCSPSLQLCVYFYMQKTKESFYHSGTAYIR